MSGAQKKRKAAADRPAAKRAKSDHIKHPALPTAEGSVFTLGQNTSGQLGLSLDTDSRKRPFPIEVKTPSGEAVSSFVQVECGGMHTVALTKDGRVFTWGVGDEGALGRKVVEDGEGKPYSEEVPSLVQGTIKGRRIVQVSCGDSHTMALAEDGSLYGWGTFRNSGGVFGFMPDVRMQKEPALLIPVTASGERVVRVVSGTDHVLALTDEGHVMSFGNHEQGALGRVGERVSARALKQTLLVPQAVRFAKGVDGTVVDIFAGSYNSFFLTSDDTVLTAGLNNSGQLGLGHTDLLHFPAKVPKLSGRSVVRMAGGQHHTLAASRGGDVWSVGCANYGRLGVGAGAQDAHEPVEVAALRGEAALVACGELTSFAVDRSGLAFAWGFGENLQLGTSGEEEDEWTPTPLKGAKIEGKKVVYLSSGGQHTALLAAP